MNDENHKDLIYLQQQLANAISSKDKEQAQLIQLRLLVQHRKSVDDEVKAAIAEL